MRSFLPGLLLVLVSTFTPRVSATQNLPPEMVREIRRAVETHVQALQAGNVKVLDKGLSGGMKAQYQTLLQKNTDYPEFLRNFYRGATFSVRNIYRDEEGLTIAELAIGFPNGATTVTKLKLEQEKTGWKIVGRAP